MSKSEIIQSLKKKNPHLSLSVTEIIFNVFCKSLKNELKKNKKLNLNIKGNLNVLNKKINFKNIEINENYKASKEDLKYFKQSFENILFDKSFLQIFDLKKLKEFILEIS